MYEDFETVSKKWKELTGETLYQKGEVTGGFFIMINEYNKYCLFMGETLIAVEGE